MDIIIQQGNPRDTHVARLLKESDAYYAALYPPESNHLLDVEDLDREGTFFFAVSQDGVVKGFGAYEPDPLSVFMEKELSA